MKNKEYEPNEWWKMAERPHYPFQPKKKMKWCKIINLVKKEKNELY